ncbi:MAG: VOC family protein [Rubrivivax sp.]
MPQQDIAIPQLPSRSLAETLQFYGRFGFQGRVAGPAADYAILERGPLEVHFWLYPALKPEESAFSCYLRVQDVEAMYRAFSSAAPLPRQGIPRMEPPEDKPWGLREFAVVDEDGNLLRIGQVL